MNEAERGVPGRPLEAGGGDGLRAEPDDDAWEVFVAEDDQCDPLPELGDFWMEREA